MLEISFYLTALQAEPMKLSAIIVDTSARRHKPRLGQPDRIFLPLGKKRSLAALRTAKCFKTPSVLLTYKSCPKGC